MATIDEVLDGIANETVTYAIDEVLFIDPISRQISVPGDELVFGVEGDGKSERKYFHCPRFVGNDLDLASCFFRVDFRNANGDVDFNLIDDVTVGADGKTITFSWELSPSVTAYKGQTKFVVCATRPSDNKFWHTTQATGLVLIGLEPDSESVESASADGIAQLVAMVDKQTAVVESKGADQVAAVQTEGATQVAAVKTAAETAEAAAVAEIEAKGVNTRNSIPDDYTALSETVNTLTRSRAGAIVCEAEGPVVAVNDASDLPMQGLRIFGRSTQNGAPSPNNPVEIVSVANPVVSVCGSNLFDGKLEIGTINANGGELYYLETESRTVNYIPVVPGMPIYIKREDTEGAIKPRFYDKEFNYLGTGTGNLKIISGYSEANPMNDGTAECCVSVTNEAIAYMKICVASVNLKNHYMVSFVNTDYEKSADNQTVSITHTLPGIPVTSGGNYTDANGQQWICDEVDLERGMYVQRVGNITLTGEETHGILAETGGEMFIQLPSGREAMYTNDIVTCKCNYYPTVARQDTFNNGQTDGYVGSAVSSTHIRITDNVRFNGDHDALISWVSEMYTDGNPVIFEYILAAPIETVLSAEEIQAFKALHSNKPNTTVLNDSGAHMVVAYAADTKLYIDNKITALVSG